MVEGCEEELMEPEQTQEETTPNQEENDIAEISLNAMVGGEGLNTIKLPGLIHKREIIILVDSGSTHNFVDPALVHQLKLPTETVCPLQVTVANGEQLSFNQLCRGFQWEIQGEVF